MKKALRILAIASGIVSIVSMVVLGFLYLEDIAGYAKSVKNRISGAISSLTCADEDSES